MFSCLGKLLIIASLCFQAYILFENATVAQQFNNNLAKAVNVCDCIPPNIAALILQYGRFVVCGLLGLSALMLVIKCWCVKLFVILGLSILLYIEHQPFTKVPCIGNTTFWSKVATIGALVYLMGVDCSKSSCSKSACPKVPADEKKQN